MESDKLEWRPVASRDMLHLRARLLRQIREFFFQRGVLEVETPLLAQSCAPERHIVPFTVPVSPPRYLQASPELAMKRLVAVGYGPLYQITKAFRAGECGRWHNPEFTLLEWYRPGFNHHDLMAEMDELLQVVLGCASAERLSYRDAFMAELGVDPFAVPLQELHQAAARWMPGADLTRDECLHLLLSHAVEPALGRGSPTFLYDFPASQAALARISPENPQVAERFEVYVEGVELANGFHELTDAHEQRRRFFHEGQEMAAQGLPVSPADERFFAALTAGLPPCAGVALGIDRLLAVLAGVDHLQGVLAFPWERA